ncbi:MAG: tRNA(Met) cytidine acetyltransferase TmcA [Pontibacterium sp.]
MSPVREAVFQLLDLAARRNQRRILVCAGEHTWGLAQAGQIQAWMQPEASLWVSRQAPEGSEHTRARDLHRYLGQETDLLVFDAWEGFNPNAFGQITGTLRGGGLLLLLCPELENWHCFDDPEHKALAVEPYGTERVGRRYIRRLARLLSASSTVSVLTQHSEIFALTNGAAPGAAEQAEVVPSPYATADQRNAVERIIRSLSRGRRPVVLTADRGRGKSAALGIVAARLISSGSRHVRVTAPSLHNVTEVFHHAAALLPGAVVEKGKLRQDAGVLAYITPDEARRQDAEGVVLLVDEAAAIPAPVLAQLLSRYSRIVFSTTVHGYEGTGQGFAVRFRRELDRRTPDWRALTLTQPVRWADNDPLESLVFDALLLNAEALGRQQAGALEFEMPDIALLNRDQLLENEPLLSELFGLLVLAHYRTTPGDLRILLDSPNLCLWVARCQGRVVGAALVAEEGPLELSLAQAIWAGKRRPKGHLLPQILIGQEGYLEAAPLRCGRIMRIAVHPELQRKGIARQMISHIADFGRRQQWDYLGSSFGATEDLLLFWQNNGFGTVRLGENRDPVSGTHAALVCRSLSERGHLMYTHLRDRFTRQLPLLLSYNLSDLDVEILPMLLQGMLFDTDLTTHDSRDLDAFIHHNRSYESCIVPIRKLVIRSLKNTTVWHTLTPDELSLLVGKVLQQRSWEEIAPHSGRRVMMRRMRLLVGECLRLF